MKDRENYTVFFKVSLLGLMYLILLLQGGCSVDTDVAGVTDSLDSTLSNDEHWPEITGDYEELVKQSVTKYHDLNYDYSRMLPEGKWNPYGDFLNWGVYSNFDNIPKDPDGIVTSGSEIERYNPVTIAQYALALYGQYLHGDVSKWAFLHQADFLLSMIERDGSIRYYFDYPYYCMSDKYFKSGWTSAMASGHVLSVCARAYHLTKDEEYCDVAEKVLAFLTVPVEEDGVMATLECLDPSLKNYVIFEEYPTEPATYTLNGYMFTLIGIYEWSCVETKSQDTAKELFEKGINTLVKILPYYDIGGFTAYDLSHITLGRDTPHIGVAYHRVHTVFCKIFYDITDIEVFNEYYLKWASYVDE